MRACSKAWTKSSTLQPRPVPKYTRPRRNLPQWPAGPLRGLGPYPRHGYNSARQCRPGYCNRFQKYTAFPASNRHLGNILCNLLVQISHPEILLPLHLFICIEPKCRGTGTARIFCVETFSYTESRFPASKSNLSVHSSSSSAAITLASIMCVTTWFNCEAFFGVITGRPNCDSRSLRALPATEPPRRATS